MSRDSAYLLDILIAARLIMSYAQDIDRTTFGADRMRQDAIMRRIEIIGEAARRISPEFRSEHPHIPWQDMIGIRNRLIHNYDEVNLNIVWNVITVDLPALVDLIAPLVPPDESGPE